MWLKYSTFTVLKCTYMHHSGKTCIWVTAAVVSLSDACDPNWHSTRDGLVFSALAVSIVVYIFAATLICIHVYWHRSEELQLYFYVMTMFSVTM